MLKLTTKKLHLFKIFLFCCFLISYNNTNAQIEGTTICLGDSILIEIPSELPEGPPGPLDQNGNPTYSCTNIVDISISPMDGVRNQTEFGFWLSPSSYTEYTITGTTGPAFPGDTCDPQSTTFQVGIQVENCNTVPVNEDGCLCDFCGYSTPLEIPWLKSYLQTTPSTSCDIYWNIPNAHYLFSPRPFEIPGTGPGFALYDCAGGFSCFTPDDLSVYSPSSGCGTTYVGTVYQSDLETYCDEDGNEYDSFCAASCIGVEAVNCNSTTEPTDSIDLIIQNETVCANKILVLDLLIGSWAINILEHASNGSLLAVADAPITESSLWYIPSDDFVGVDQFTIQYMDIATGNEYTAEFTVEVIDCSIDPIDPNIPYDWLNNLIDQNDCCNNSTVLEFSLGGSYSFIYIKAAEECGGLGTLYLNDQTLYCTDASNFDCLGAYGLNESDGNVLYNCSEEPIEPTDTSSVAFDDYPWLTNLIDANDCCTNQSIINFPLGSYSFIYIKTASECGSLGSLYLNNGNLYCNDASNFDCLGAYGLSENDGEVLWNCGDPITPTDPSNPIDSEEYPWLSSIANAGDCCANANIFYYKKDNCTHGYIYVKAGDCEDENYGRLYSEEGQLYCFSTATISCFEHYDLGNSFIEELLWSCDGTDDRPYQSSEDNNSRLITNDISLGLNVFPNPSRGLVNIEVNTDENYEGEQFISVYDINGRIIRQEIFDTANVRLFQTDLSDLTGGIYIIEYKNANISSAQKIMIRR